MEEQSATGCTEREIAELIKDQEDRNGQEGAIGRSAAAPSPA